VRDPPPTPGGAWRSSRPGAKVSAATTGSALLLYCFVSFIAFGVVLVLVGANQNDMARELDLDLTRTGMLASALALGLGVGVLGAGPLYDRLPRRPLFALSMLLAGAALLSVDSSMSFARWLAQLALTGIGIGAYDTLINASVVERFGTGASRPMTLVHAGAAVGAIAGPFAVEALAAAGDWTASFRWVGMAHFGLAGVALALRFPTPVRRAAAGSRRREAARIGTAVLPYAAVAFAYVGIEGALIVFAEPYAGSLGLDPSRGARAISAVWLGLLIGRLGVLALRELDARLLAGVGLAAGALLLGAVGSGLTAIEGVFFALGLPLGCVYPVMISLAGQRLPERPGLTAGSVAAAGALGGFAVPWLTGALGDELGAGAALASLALWSLLITGAAAAAARLR
jgi:fucose permease